MSDFAAFGTRSGAGAGFDLQLKSTETGEPVPGAVLRIRGRDSREYQRALNEQFDKIREIGAQDRQVTREDRSRMELELAASLVIGWPAGWTMHGEALPYSAANAIKLLDESPAIREQIEEAASRRANFLQDSGSG